jgi:hypothetical protein
MHMSSNFIRENEILAKSIDKRQNSLLLLADMNCHFNYYDIPEDSSELFNNIF